jgi:hypothetical protein
MMAIDMRDINQSSVISLESGNAGIGADIDMFYRTLRASGFKVKTVAWIDLNPLF